jgi:hypothetical protein
MQKIGIAELRSSFADMPELLGRLDSIVVFQELERPQFEQIFNKFIDEINLDQRGGMNFLAVTKEARNYVLDHAETGEYGAREIRHKLNTHIVDPASEIKYSGVLPEMAPLIADMEGDEVIFWTSNVVEKKPEPITTLQLVKDPEPINEDLPIQSQRDPGSYIGNKEPTPIIPPKAPKPEAPKEERDEPEDTRGPKSNYNIELTYEDGTTEKITGLDYTIAEMLMQGIAENPENNGKRIVSSRSKLMKPEKKGLGFVIPADGVIFDTMDLAITIRAGGHEYQQLVERMPIVKTK